MVSVGGHEHVFSHRVEFRVSVAQGACGSTTTRAVLQRVSGVGFETQGIPRKCTQELRLRSTESGDPPYVRHTRGED